VAFEAGQLAIWLVGDGGREPALPFGVGQMLMCVAYIAPAWGAASYAAQLPSYGLVEQEKASNLSSNNFCSRFVRTSVVSGLALDNRRFGAARVSKRSWRTLQRAAANFSSPHIIANNYAGHHTGVLCLLTLYTVRLSQCGADALVRARPPGRALALIVNSNAGHHTSSGIVATEFA
jgi:hypothetical protein